MLVKDLLITLKMAEPDAKVLLEDLCAGGVVSPIDAVNAGDRVIIYSNMTGL